MQLLFHASQQLEERSHRLYDSSIGMGKDHTDSLCLMGIRWSRHYWITKEVAMRPPTDTGFAKIAEQAVDGTFAVTFANCDFAEAFDAIAPSEFNRRLHLSNVDTELLVFSRDELLRHFAGNPTIAVIVTQNVAAVIGHRLKVFQTMWTREMQRTVELRCS